MQYFERIDDLSLSQKELDVIDEYTSGESLWL